MGQVLVTPLNWGLGHAMRDVPVIQALIDRGNEVTIAACGNALISLQREFPSCRFNPLEDYPSPYSTGRFFLPKLGMYLPILLRAIAHEQHAIQHIVAKDHYDLIISDNRLGAYSTRVPSLFITHQLHFHLPLFLWPVELFASYVSRFLYAKYDRIIVPDNPPGPLSLAGKLSQPDSGVARSKAYFAGILTSVPRQDIPRDLNYLILISGPEPQRTRLEEILLAQVSNLDGQSVVLLGSPQSECRMTGTGDCSIRGYVSNEEKAALMNRAQFVICRSGYTTMMELAELNKCTGLFIPTPGQPEQEYLSWYYRKKNWFLSAGQYDLCLPDDIRAARKFPGFPAMPRTATNVSRLYDEVLAGYVE